MPLLLNGFENHRIDTGEVEIAYSVGPDSGPPLLMLHGFTVRRDIFLREIDSLTSNFKVITMDQRGHCDSGHVSGKNSRTEHARDIKFAIGNICNEAPIVWGHSIGGGNAVELGGKESHLFRALVLEDPGLLPPTGSLRRKNTPSSREFRALVGILDAKLSTEGLVQKIRELIPIQLDFYASWRAESLLQLDEELLRTFAHRKSAAGNNPAENLVNIHCSVLLLQVDPDSSGILPDDYLQTIASNRDYFTIKKIVGAGHNIRLECPDLLLPVVLPWLTELT